MARAIGAAEGWQGGLALAADCGVDPGGEFARAEGFGDVVIGSELEEEDFVGNFSDGAEDDDRSLAGLGFEFLTQFAAGDMGEDQVENDGEGPFAAKQFERGMAIRSHDGGVTFLSEDATENALHTLVVFDDEDRAKAGGGRNFGLWFGYQLKFLHSIQDLCRHFDQCKSISDSKRRGNYNPMTFGHGPDAA